jgi:rare lipoprotein A
MLSDKNHWVPLLILGLSTFFLAGTLTLDEPAYSPTVTSMIETAGFAAVYPDKFKGKLMANDEIYAPEALLAAHRTLPINTLISVTNPQLGRSVIVRVTDRYIENENHFIALSKAAAREIGLLKSPRTKVEIKILSYDN